MKKFIRSVPMAICGVSLALAALGNLLLPTFGPVARYICGILSAALLVIFVLKLILDYPHAREELKTPIPLSVLPTATMTVMLLSAYIRPHMPGSALFIWYCAIIAHLGIMLIFAKRFMAGLKARNVFPTWFITFVGIAIASVTAPAMGAVQIGQAVFYLGFVLYFAALPLVVCRMIKADQFFPQPAQPTIAIFAAPMSLLIVGYFSSFQQRNEMLVYFMLALALASYIYVTIKMLTSLLKIKFYPTCAAYTFPYVISAAAFRLGAAFLAEQGINFLTPIAQLSQLIAVMVVAYVVVHYVMYFRFWLKF